MTQHRRRYTPAFIALAMVVALSACGTDQTNSSHPADRLTSFSQEITSPIQHFQVKAGAPYVIVIGVKNTGTEPWFGDKGQAMSVDAGYRWIDSSGNTLPIEGNRALLTRPVIQPGESDSLKLQVVAPHNPGSYTLRVSMVQEGVDWFYLQGANPLNLRVDVN